MSAKDHKSTVITLAERISKVIIALKSTGTKDSLQSNKGLLTGLKITEKPVQVDNL
ncbi:hypothetical protein HMPREF9554_01825 [Treponema phagedenis F0421]|uniref:hypothetical protein n=1 Tax=Treponema phagedenis TaxID=162 RepID=UPI0001F64149|nr:hypothetical protein [Treponema phagedenis]EFW37634.1 hypothetical protein HMPREF9554_01825 [Treponema phagedenis F0421]